jgi:magnesium-transporting ATPase (P-type)
VVGLPGGCTAVSRHVLGLLKAASCCCVFESCLVSSYKGADPLAMPALPLPQGLLPPKARLLLGDGSWREVPSESVAAGDVLTVLPGDRVPVDGVRAKPAYPPACQPASLPV